MKNIRIYQPFDSFLFRTPFFSFNNLDYFDINTPIFREMLQIATPDLSDILERDNKEQIKDKVIYSCYRYFQRACTRSTPFGLFAGCSIGKIDEQTAILLSDTTKYKRYTRLDMNYICALIQQIEKDKNLRTKLMYYSNTSIYPIGNRLRYVEYFYSKTNRIYQIASVDNSEYLKKIIHSAERDISFFDLVSILTSEGIDTDIATDFIHELIDQQLLMSNLQPAITNTFLLSSLISKLKQIDSTDKEFVLILELINRRLAGIDKKPVGQANERYTKVVKEIENIRINTEIKYLFQVDVFKPVQFATVSQGIIDDIQDAIIFLNKITPSYNNTLLSQFKESFSKRFEEQEVPLLYALDNEIGVGYYQNLDGNISPLVDDLLIQQALQPTNTSISPFQKLMLQKYQKLLKKNDLEIILTDNDIQDMKLIWEDLPGTISVMCQIIKEDIDGRCLYIKFIGGPSANNLLGRFCHLDDRIYKHALRIAEKETQNDPNIIFAEIIHLPESRTGNILLRPVLRKYEISCLTKSGVTREYEISLSDLFLSIRNNQFVLRSKRLNKEIIPRMSTAHNYSGQSSMPVYHFLCDMQHQEGRSALFFYWGELANQFDYLPIVSYKNCIISPARWIVHNKEILPFLKSGDDNSLLKEVQSWLIERNIPERVLWVEGDNELYVDLLNPLSIRTWLSVVKKRHIIRMEEMLFNPETAIIKGKEGGVYNNEFLFAFYKDIIKTVKQQ